MISFDVASVPFSRYGSYLSVSHTSGPSGKGLYLRTVHGRAIPRELLLLEPVHNGSPVSYVEDASPDVLRLESSCGWVEICLSESDVVRLRGEGIGLRLSAEAALIDPVIPIGQNLDSWLLNFRVTRVKLLASVMAGQLTADTWAGSGSKAREQICFAPDQHTNRWEGFLGEFGGAFTLGAQFTLGARPTLAAQATPAAQQESFEQCRCRAHDEFASWLAKAPEIRDGVAGDEKLSVARELAAYVNWSAVVRPSGILKRPAMLMSKNWMTNVWAWDHCFNAMALAMGNPEAAWDQFMLLFDHQDENGGLPDVVNDCQPEWNYCKPPIHGWALKWMMKHSEAVTVDRLLEAYEPLCRWTRWWTSHRDYNRNGFAEYTHGNDSGWDNSTVFRHGAPVESPELCAFLVLQMEALAEVAAILGRSGEAADWRAQAEHLLRSTLARFWRGDRFVAVKAWDGGDIESESLLLFVPLVLGKRLPEGVRQTLVQRLATGGWLTSYGLATELPTSEYYDADGYWRGPIWAPSTMLIVDGLVDAGEDQLASEISRKFCLMAAKAGMAENFDALTGQGLRDQAYTWTSSTFLVLASMYI